MRGTAKLAEMARQQSLQWPGAVAPKVEQWLTVKDVCHGTQLAEATVRKYAAQGKLKGYRVGGDYRFKEADVDEFMTATPATKTEGEE
ncbi:MAG: helix-turn-helix domain-containing protein [Mycobacterium sp.]|uniref:helix-turn-helix domain-containing protein n=1 Tax=Mycobacterium sp. TaxID=1785 RepID=UPI003F957130